MSRTRPTSRQRQNVIARAGGRCEYCLAPQKYSNAPLAVEHIYPVARGGLTVMGNLAFACGGCNGHKADKIEARDPQTGETAPLFHPRRQKWRAHFAWDSADQTQVIGLTQTGRATVAALQLNRQPLANLRWLLYLSYEHPPVKDE